MSSHDVISKIGIRRVEEGFSSFVSYGAALVQRSIQPDVFGSDPRCAFEPSFIQVPRTKSSTEGRILALDFGGSRVKCGVVTTYNNQQRDWEILFDFANEDLFEASDELPIVTFIRRVVREIASRSRNAAPFQGVGVVWSNQLRMQPIISNRVKGVTGIVAGRHEGGYCKSEWYIEQLEDGFDLGQLFLDEFQKLGTVPQVLLLGNDTTFTLAAKEGARAGIVVSSGANCTLVGTHAHEKDFIFNSELGGMCPIPDMFLSEGDKLFSQLFDVPVTLETLIAGKWLARIALCQIEAATKLGIEGFSEIGQLSFVHKDFFNTSDLAEIVRFGECRDPEVAKALSINRAGIIEICRATIHRAGVIMGAMAYWSVVNQLAANDPLVDSPILVSLDSSMARFLPEYYETAKQSAEKICSRINISLQYPLKLSSSNKVSVPLIGVSETVASLL